MPGEPSRGRSRCAGRMAPPSAEAPEWAQTAWGRRAGYLVWKDVPGRRRHGGSPAHSSRRARLSGPRLIKCKGKGVRGQVTRCVLPFTSKECRSSVSPGHSPRAFSGGLRGVLVWEQRSFVHTRAHTHMHRTSLSL